MWSLAQLVKSDHEVMLPTVPLGGFVTAGHDRHPNFLTPSIIQSPRQGCGLKLAGPGTLVWPMRTVLVLVLMPAPARRLDPSKPFQSCSSVPFLGPSTRDAAQVP